MKKQILALIVCAALTLSVGCSDNNAAQTSADTTASTTVTETTDKTDITTTATENTTLSADTTPVSASESETTANTDSTTAGTESTTKKTESTTGKTEVTTKKTSATKPDDNADPNSPTASEVAKAMGLALSLGNTMEAYDATNCEKITYEWIPTIGSNTPRDYETRWGCAVTTQKIIDGMKAEGFSTVRIPVFWGNMMKDDGTYTINSEYIARVKEIVDYCQKAGMYAVINIHHFDEFIIRRNNLEDCKKIFTTLWTQIAEYFKDYPYTVIFEGFNEYLGGNQFNSSGTLVELSKDDGYKLTNALNQVFVNAVRATGGNNAERVLIASGYWTNIDLTTSAKFKMPNDTVKDRLMVSVHYVDNNMYWSNKIGGTEWLNYIDNQCEKLKKAFTDKGIPVFMGETTSTYPKSNFAYNATYTSSTECLEIVMRELLDYGFVPAIWDTNSNFYSRSTYRIVKDSDRELIKTLAQELKN